jgi:hypothetical protein
VAKSIKPVLLDDDLIWRQLFAILVLVTFLLGDFMRDTPPAELCTDEAIN